MALENGWEQAVRDFVDNKVGDIIAARKHTQLIYVDYRDQLTREQVKMALDTDEDNAWELDDSVSESFSDQRWENSVDVVIEALSEVTVDDVITGLPEAALFAPTLFDELTDGEMEQDVAALESYLSELGWSDLPNHDGLILSVQEADESDPVTDLMRNTDSQLFRMRIAQVGDEIETANLLDRDEYDRAVSDVAQALREAGIGIEQADEAAQNMLQECGDWLHEGFRLDVIWYGDLESVYRAKNGDTLAFTNPHVVLLDCVNGAGMDTEVLGDLQLVRGKAHTIVLDSDRNAAGYGWDDTAGVSKGAYACDVKVTHNNTEG